MEKTRNERFVILLVSLACIGLTVESAILGWEFWVPPLIIIGTASLWAMNIMEKPDYSVRKIFYFVFATLTLFFHGVHETSFFDVSIVISLVMVAFSVLNLVYMMNIALVEYAAILCIQITLALRHHTVEFDMLNVSRIILHIVSVIIVYSCCIRSINEKLEFKRSDEEKDRRIEAYDEDMEDFLSNISHELRTPVNVVNGMSDLMLKRNAGYEAGIIKDAGIRLANQIEDIQDYTECKRQKVMLENEKYMSTSLVNDLVANFRLMDNNRNLELVVDLDPEVPSLLIGDVKKIHKILRHLMENGVKFTRQGGIYVRVYSEKSEGDVNLCLEVADTGIGMDRRATQSVAEGMYQGNKKRNRSSGGIGIGLFIVYGFAHSMGGFVKIESDRKNGTLVRVTLPQKVADPAPCLSLSDSYSGDIIFYVRPDKYKVPRIRDFYRKMAASLASGIHVPLYSAEGIKDIERFRDKLNVKYIFTGQEEYEENPEYFDNLSKGGVVVAVSASPGFESGSSGRVIVIPKPIYAYPVIRILNEGQEAWHAELSDDAVKPGLSGVRALVVDDEPMNLVVAAGLFRDYEMIIDTADSGREAIAKFRKNDYDIVFLDHMMPEMDGVEAMKRIKKEAADLKKEILVVALTANAVSGAREMFMQEGFDGFIAKPINTADFERVMLKILPGPGPIRGGDGS